MKKVLILAVALVLVAVGVSFAGIATSKHDLSAAGGVYTGGTMSSCQYCHTPHLRTNSAVSGLPLWNKDLTTSGIWTMYNSGSTTAGTSIDSDPGAQSRSCLSCHDGTVAIGNVLVGTSDTLVLATNLVGGKLGATNINLTTDLSNEHPIGFTVDTTKAGLDSIANMKADGFTFYVGDTKMECATCHDPHDTSKGSFLRVAKGTICTACHVDQ
jgi:predicted CXXCH cytochrome family protein